MLMGFVSVYTSFSACLSGEKEGIQNENAEPLRADGFLICIPSLFMLVYTAFLPVSEEREYKKRKAVIRQWFSYSYLSLSAPLYRSYIEYVAAYKKPAIEIRNALTYWSPSFRFL